ncbi:MAG: glycosyltransferase [Xanthobacteraceae bacterium]
MEQSYAAALSEIMPERLRLCRYHAARRRFIPVDALPRPVAPAESPLRMSDKAEAFADESAGLGRRMEQSIRRWRRNAARAIYGSFGSTADTAAFPDARRGDVLLLAGETWGQHDFAVLRALRDHCGLHLAAVLQDMIPIKCPQFFEGGRFIERFRDYADFIATDTDLVLAISETTEKDLEDYARTRGGVRSDLRTIELGHSGLESAGAKPLAQNLDPGRFVLCVSAFQSRKNIDLLYHVWRRLSEAGILDLPKLVLVGRRGFGGSDLLGQIARDPVIRDSIAVFPGVSDPTLSWLYRNCAWTLYPSFYEGWGLPISESLSYGKYCLASNAPALVEAGQGLVGHLDPLDFVAWRDAVIELVGSPELIAAFERKIKDRYRAVSWKQSAMRLVELLQPLYETSA